MAQLAERSPSAAYQHFLKLGGSCSLCLPAGVRLMHQNEASSFQFQMFPD